jgi:hypothetical protein
LRRERQGCKRREGRQGRILTTAENITAADDENISAVSLKALQQRGE